MQDNKYPFKIAIDDGDCAYQYEFSTDGNVSIEEIAKAIHEFLKVEGDFKEGALVREWNGENDFFKN